MNVPLIREARLDALNAAEMSIETAAELARAHAMSAAFDAMVATAGRFDGPYDAARDRFNSYRKDR